MKHFSRALRVAVVTLEEAYGFLVAKAYHDLTLLTRFYRTAVGINKIDVILRVGKSHTSGFGCHPRHVADRTCRFRLPESLHERNTREFLEGVKDGGVEGFPGNRTIFEGGEVESG